MWNRFKRTCFIFLTKFIFFFFKYGFYGKNREVSLLELGVCRQFYSVRKLTYFNFHKVFYDEVSVLVDSY